MKAPSEFFWLEASAVNDYSQFGEDGILQTIFSVIGAVNQWCFECGAADGLFFSNTRRLIEQGWNAVLVEGDDRQFARLLDNNAGRGDRVKCLKQMVGGDYRIDGILQSAGAPPDIDLMVIDVDGQDYYLFNAVIQYRPRVVMIEFNEAADEDFTPVLGGPGQAGALSICRLMGGKGYDLVAVTGCNGIFVKRYLSRALMRSPIKGS